MAKTLADFIDRNGFWVRGFGSNSICYITKSAQTYNHMKARCKVRGKYQKRKPTYIGCSIDKEFLDFQYFADWYNKQIGCGYVGYQLDKDLLVPGNKFYSPATCVLIPQQLNMFLVNPVQSNSSQFGRGVSQCAKTGKFRAAVKFSNKQVNLGYYDTQEQASAAYKAAKEAEAYRWYERLKAGEFVVDPRVIERMRTWRLV